MAAGLGSRFAGGIKQLEPIDSGGHIIMDYSIHDAIEAGFSHIIFVIRKDIFDEFQDAIGNRIEDICRQHGVRVDYAFQDIRDIPGVFPKGRTKPWGTGQAVLAAEDYIRSPFAVINADDYYGKTAFIDMHDWLVSGHSELQASLSGFLLKNTLSDNGGVTRGICTADSQNRLISIDETKNIMRAGPVIRSENRILDPECPVSMNMWGFHKYFLTVLRNKFREFFKEDVPGNPMKAEFLLPVVIGELLNNSGISVDVLKTEDSWFGVTYREDTESVRKNFRTLIDIGVYKNDLFSDL